MKRKRRKKKNKSKNKLNFNLCNKREIEICSNKCKKELNGICTVDNEMCIVISSECNSMIRKDNRMFIRKEKIIDSKRIYNRKDFKYKFNYKGEI